MQADEKKESVFHMASAYLARIDKLLYLSQEAALRYDADSWLNYLRAIERELSIEISAEEKEEIEKAFEAVTEISSDPERKTKEKQKLFFKLHILDKKLREIMQKKKMLLPAMQEYG